MGTIVSEIVDLTSEINKEVDELVDMKRSAMRIINQMEDVKEQTVLIEKYMNGKQWFRIMADMDYSERNIHYIHSRALQSFESLQVIAVKSAI